MELKDILKRIKKYKIFLVLFAIAGFSAGALFYAIPSKYISSGSFYIKRGVNLEKEYFTYEGYYAQQTALAYTNSVAALIESPDIKKKVLEEMKIPVNEESLRKLNKIVRVKKTGPQIILVTVKDKDYDTSAKMWNKLAESLINKTNEINKNGDESLSIGLVSEQPLVRETYKSFYLFALVGSVTGLSLAIFFICVKEYFRDKER